MPEAIEVNNFYKFVKQHLQIGTLYEIEIISGRFLKKAPEHFDECICDKKLILKEILIKGKTIFFKFDNEITIAIIHGMSGSWSIEMDKHTRFQFKPSQLLDKKVFFNDIRSFGKMVIFKNEKDFEKEFNRLGPNVLDITSLTSSINFLERISKKKNIPIGVALLDQTLIAGIGNYLRCDILWKAGIHYATPVKKVDLHILFDAIVYCIDFHVNNQETQNYTCLVYMQDFDPNGLPVYRTKWRGRTIHSNFV